MRKRRIMAMTLAAVMAASLTACGGSDKGTTTRPLDRTRKALQRTAGQTARRIARRVKTQTVQRAAGSR